MDDQPFTTVESAELHKLFLLMNPAAFTPSADTIRSYIMDAFVLEHTKVHDILQVYINFVLYHYMYLKSTNTFNQNAPGLISFTLDTWTSPNAISFLGITAHWIDDNWKLMETLADFHKLSGPHSGENLAEAFMDSCNELGILTKVSTRIFFLAFLY